MNRRVTAAVVISGLFLGAGCSSADPQAQEPTAPPTVELPRSDTAPAGVDNQVLHDFTESGSARMIGIWEDTVVLTTSDSTGQYELAGWSASTGQQVWRKEVEPQLGTESNLSNITITMQFDAVAIFEVWAESRLDKVAQVTLIDPSTGITRASTPVPKFRREGVNSPFGVFVEPWDNRYVAYLSDGRSVRMPSTKTTWMIATPEGSDLWVGTGEAWPNTEQYDDESGQESVSWTRAIRRAPGSGGLLEIEVLDSSQRKSLSTGCAGLTFGAGGLVVSPHRTWAAYGNVAIEIDSGTIHCNEQVFALGGRALAVGDDGQIFGASGTKGVNEEFFVAATDGPVNVLPAGGTSSFDTESETLHQTVALVDESLVVGGRVFALPAVE